MHFGGKKNLRGIRFTLKKSNLVIFFGGGIFLKKNYDQKNQFLYVTSSNCARIINFWDIYILARWKDIYFFQTFWIFSNFWILSVSHQNMSQNMKNHDFWQFFKKIKFWWETDKLWKKIFSPGKYEKFCSTYIRHVSGSQIEKKLWCFKVVSQTAVWDCPHIIGSFN